jgi:hypothetical protein
MIVSIDGGSSIDKDVVAIIARVENPRVKVVRKERHQPKNVDKLSKTKEGVQKMCYYLAHPRDWKIIRDKTIIEIIDFHEPGIIKIEPNFGSYPNGRDKAKIINYAREKGWTIYECDPNLTSRRRMSLGIPVNIKKNKIESVDDSVDAAIIAAEPLKHFGKSRLASEKRQKLDRSNVKSLLEDAETSGWSDNLSKEALSVVSAKEIERLFGPDLAQPVFIVTAYAAAKDPQCINRREFDRFCGCNAKSRLSSKIGIGSVVSSNLSHFNNNPKNIQAARHIRSLYLASVNTHVSDFVAVLID